MSDTQLLLVGPAFAFLALVIFAIPGVRPKVYPRSIGWLAACMCVPMVAGFAFDSYVLITVAFVTKPITALIGGALVFAYLVMWASKRFSLLTALPSLMILVGSVADIHAVRQLAHGWGGANC